MIWTIFGFIVIAIAFAALDATVLSTGLFAWLFVRGIGKFAESMEKKTGFDDPVYKKNLQGLIERNRQFEEARNEPRS
jgi:hypothetical protein